MPNIAIIGLGYVGLPLAVEFGKRYPTVGIDLSESKINHYQRHVDPSGEVSSEELRALKLLTFSSNAENLRTADYIIIAVPTPIDSARQPDFRPLISASRSAGRYMKQGVVVIYESTVYPGATEEICIPVLEQASGMKWKEHFHIGYSPERINPGDRQHTLTNTVKVVSGDSRETLAKVADLYEKVVEAGVHRVSGIRVAEAAKVIENTQRDINIALMNELAVIFNMIGIDTLEVLEAAGSKWNFLPFRPGLVGGHCIGVDPYYLTHKAEMLGYHPDVILSGRRINDGMGKYIAEQTIKHMIAAGSPIRNAKVNVLGLTFKENVPDLRNSKVVNLIRELESYGVDVHVHDPVADPAQARHECGVELQDWDALPRAEAVVLAVAHQQFLAKSTAEFRALLSRQGCFMDVKSQVDEKALRDLGVRVWRL